MKLTSTQLVELQKCKNTEEVIEKAKTQGIEMTFEEAKRILAIVELDENSLTDVTGGNKFADPVSKVHCNKCGKSAKYVGTTYLTRFNLHCYICDCGYETIYFGDEYQCCNPVRYE